MAPNPPFRGSRSRRFKPGRTDGFSEQRGNRLGTTSSSWLLAACSAAGLIACHAGATVGGGPVVWVSDRAVGSAGIIWTEVAEKSARSGLLPFLLSSMPGDTARPWDTGEQVGEPEDTAAIDRMDAAEVLEGWWWTVSEEELG